MTLLITRTELDARLVSAGPAGTLLPLTQSLASELEPVVARDLFIPAEKALLSREGGRCHVDGTMLDFDPTTPHSHRCATCGRIYVGDAHYRYWIYNYQLWLAERAVHGALLGILTGRSDLIDFAGSVLGRYAALYPGYPNRDNVLGPTRLFFSTYLESIWLLQICVATDLMEAAGATTLGQEVRDRIIVPSRAIIASYDEGLSNRQVWNNAALLASSILIGDAAAAERDVFGPSGLARHLAKGLLADGTWYEGENYHLFAHRGLWYGVTMAERAGMNLPGHLVERFQEGFATPFATALPDFTLPSRRDSQYAISLRQWRIAEHVELGLARAQDPRLVGALARLYLDDIPRRDTQRWRSAADVERNAPPSLLSRADLGWRALLHACPQLPDLERVPPRSVLLESQGMAVLRRDAGKAYVALDYGHSGGGHGHPDRLNLLLVDGATRWLDDMGTGSYVDRSLYWYRSTLAHNAPLIDGRSQKRIHGSLRAYDERGAAGWIMAAANEIAPLSHISRTIVVLPGYVIDELDWRADHPVTVDLPFHVDGQIQRGAGPLTEARMTGGAGHEDGFGFLENTAVQFAPAGEIVELDARSDSAAALKIWSTSDRDMEWWRAVAPGPPGTGQRPFRILRAEGEQGVFRTVYCWTGEVQSVEFGERIVVKLTDGAQHIHGRSPEGWHIDLLVGQARSSIDLGGIVEPAQTDVPRATTAHGVTTNAVFLPVGEPATFELGELNYRRSEESWKEAGRPSAIINMQWSGRQLGIEVVVPRSDLTFVPSNAINPLDNEHPDINGDGVQLYVESAEGRSAWVLVPEFESDNVRRRLIDGWTHERRLDATWSRVNAGYRMSIQLPIDEPGPMALDVIVNEKPDGRDRRRGQLVMSGAAREFVYLRGDRHDAARLIPIVLANV